MRSKIDAFQLKGLRQILKLETTYINRENTNERVIELANEELNRRDENIRRRNRHIRKSIVKFTDYIDKQALKLFGHLVRAPNDDPMRQVTFQAGNCKPSLIGIKRVGQPRHNWIKHNTATAWELAKTALNRPNTPFNYENQQHHDDLMFAAQLYTF